MHSYRQAHVCLCITGLKASLTVTISIIYNLAGNVYERENIVIWVKFILTKKLLLHTEKNELCNIYLITESGQDIKRYIAL